MRRRDFLSGFGAAAAHAAGRRPPNIVFVLIDDLRWDALGATGHPFAQTPHIDRLAREGARFTNAFVTTPLCSPARASFLTGQFVRTHGVKNNLDNSELSHRLVTWPRLLHDSGYETAYVGKWHMGNDDTPRPGFDRWVGFRGQGQYENPEMNIDGRREKRSGYMTDLLAEEAVSFLKQPRRKPFCLYLAHKAVHGPFTPAERHRTLYEAEPIPRAPSAKDSLRGKPAMTRRLDDLPGAQKKKGTQILGPGDDLIRNQLRCLKSIDEGVGEVLKALEATGQLDDTLVLFTSDNGYFWGEHGLGDKRWAYEEAIRIPMVVRYPRLITPGLVVNQDVLNVDIAPTMLSLARAKAPATMQGRDLLPLFGRREVRWRESFLSEYYQERQYPRAPTWEAVRTPQWKYIRYPELEGMDELYDLTADRYEMNNLIADSGAKPVVERMRAELAAQTKALGPMVP